MMATSKGFGDGRLDASIASIIGGTPDGIGEPAGFERRGLRQSNKASATAVASLGLALLVGSAILLRRTDPDKPAIRHVETRAPSQVVSVDASSDIGTASPPAVPAYAAPGRQMTAAQPEAEAATAKVSRLTGIASQATQSPVAIARPSPPRERDDVVGMKAGEDIASLAPSGSSAIDAAMARDTDDEHARAYTAAPETRSVEQATAQPSLKRVRQDAVNAMRALRRQW